MPHFQGEEYQNVYVDDGNAAFTEEYKQKAVEVVRMNNTHKCSTAINGCKKDDSEEFGSLPQLLHGIYSILACIFYS